MRLCDGCGYPVIDRTCACRGIVEELKTENAKLREYAAPVDARASTPRLKQCNHNEYWTTFSGRCMACRAEDAELQLGEAMKACPWATHSKDHTEPKHCIASLAALIEMRQTEKRIYEPPKCCCDLVKAGHGGYCQLHG